MKHKLYGIAAALMVTFAASSAMADVTCGLNNGEAATGDPVKVGGIYGVAPPGDFSVSTTTARAYFDCVNANGGLNGRPIEYLTENDQWSPEVAAQVAAKLLVDEEVVALVANGSFVEMAVNAQTYVDQNVMSMASACVPAECWETPNQVSTNQGPLASSVGAVQYMVEEQGTQSVVCVALGVGTLGDWSCDAVTAFMEAKGMSGYKVLINPASPDINSALLEAISSGADTILVNLPAGLAVGVLKAAEEQGFGDSYKWTSSTPLYDASTPEAIGAYWNDKMYINAELTPWDKGGPDATNWLALMDAYAPDEAPRDTFSQAGYLSAKIFVDTMLKMDPADLDDRAKVTDAIRAIRDYESDLVCGPYYVGDGDRHMPNHAGTMVLVTDGGFQTVRDCYEYDSPYFEPIFATEAAMGMR